MSARIAAFAEARDNLLARIAAELEHDDRFLAAWLTGSFGRGEQDVFSDLDLTVVVDDTAAQSLCRRTALVQAGATHERRALFGSFSSLLNVHENHHNAPPEATFTSVVYATTGLCVDWVLAPRAHARRPSMSRLLFDTVGVAVDAQSPAPSSNIVAEQLSERVAFYWMLIFPTAKALLRGDAVRFQSLLAGAAQTRLDVEQLLTGVQPGYRRGPASQLLTSATARLDALRAEAKRMASLSGAVTTAGARAPHCPLATLEAVLQLAGNPLRVVPLRAEQCEQTCAVLARAFHDYPLMVYTMPNPVERQRKLLLEQTWNVQHGRMFGHVVGIGDPLIGVAIVYPPGDDHFSAEKKRQSGYDDLAAALGSGSGKSADTETISIFDYGENDLMRAVPESHWWLEAIAVDPAAQNRGLGGQLLDALHALTDAAGQPLILLTHDARAVPFYLRHGYELVCEGTEPTSGVRHWGLRRDAYG